MGRGVTQGACHNEKRLEGHLMPGNPKVRADIALLEDIDDELILSMFEEGRSKADI